MMLQTVAIRFCERMQFNRLRGRVEVAPPLLARLD